LLAATDQPDALMQSLLHGTDSGWFVLGEVSLQNSTASSGETRDKIKRVQTNKHVVQEFDNLSQFFIIHASIN
jgi:hypothetical protein